MLDILTAIKTGMSIYKVVELFLVEIYDEIGKVYIDLADAHFLSAKQAYKAYRNSSNPEAEIRAIINHLRDSHNIYYSLVRRTETTTFLLFMKVTNKPSCNNKTTNLTTDIAAIISLLYLELGEIDNARDWKRQSLENFNYHEMNYELDFIELSKINPEFAYRKSRPLPGCVFNMEDFISDKGKDYAMDCLRKKKSGLLNILNF